MRQPSCRIFLFDRAIPVAQGGVCGALRLSVGQPFLAVLFERNAYAGADLLSPLESTLVQVLILKRLELV